MGHGGGQTHYKPTTTICGIGGTLYGATDIEILEGVGEDFGGRGRILGEGGRFQRGKGKISGGEGADFWGEGEYFGEGRGKISGERWNCGGDVDQQPGRPATQSGTCRGRW